LNANNPPSKILHSTVVEGWVENPYWQYFCGGPFFEHRFPIDPSSMTRFKDRLKKAGLEELLKEMIRTGLRGGFIKSSELKRVNVDTTVQEKEVLFLTDTRLYNRCYEFGCKVGIATTSKENWALASLAFHGNAYDGHTLKQTLDQVTRVTGIEPLQVAVDLGYRGHNYEGDCKVLIANRYWKSIPASLKRWWKRRSAVEPVIGHMKHEHGMERNRLKGKAGDFVNAMLSACGYNLRKLFRAIARFFAPIFYWLLDL